MINIVLVDDQQLFRKGLTALIESFEDFNVLYDCSNGSELLEKLPLLELPSIILLDLEMPVMNGVETMKMLRQHYPQIHVIVLSVHFEPTYIVQMIELGASGYLQKNEGPERVNTVIKNIYTNGFYLDKEYAEALRSGDKLHRQIDKSLKFLGITKREREILVLICSQLTNVEIAEKLFISERTVEGHRNNLLEKTGCKNTAGLVVFAVKNRMINFL